MTAPPKLVTARDRRLRLIRERARAACGFDPLNPELVLALAHLCGDVVVTKVGQSAPLVWSRDGGRWHARHRHFGENYLVACPLCDDGGRHCSISYLWLSYADAPDGSEHRVYSGATCFRCGCFAATGCPPRCPCDDCEAKREFREAVLTFDFDAALAQPLPSRIVRTSCGSPGIVGSPGRVIPLSRLDDADPAREYVRSRGLDPDQLSLLWAVGVLVEPVAALARRAGDLYLPIVDDYSALAYNAPPGWQLRSIDPNCPKQYRYYTAAGFAKSQHLAGHRRLAGQLWEGQWIGPPTLVLCEGLTDAYAVDGCPYLGSVPSAAQLDLIAGYPGIVVWAPDGDLAARWYDPDHPQHRPTARSMNHAWAGLCEMFPGRAVLLRLRPEHDPASIGRDRFRHLADLAAWKQIGRPLDWSAW